MQVIGLCRFSYPALGGFQVEHETTEERTAYLYATHRLEERFRLFETVCLPSLQEQTDGEFDFLIVTGDSLPRLYRDRLYDLTTDMSQVQILSEPPLPQREVMKNALNAARRDPAQPCLQFRHDDDDAISVDFVERLRDAARDCAGLFAQNETVAFDWNRGYSAEFSATGIRASDLFNPFFGVALAMYSGPHCPQTIMNYSHYRMNRFMPTVSFTDAPMYVRSLNGFNDSRQGPADPIETRPLNRVQEAEFQARFGIDAEQVKRIFARPVP